MRRMWMFAIALCLVLTGCGRDKPHRQMQDALEFRTEIMAAQTCTFLADVSADYGDRVYTFSLECTYTPGGDGFLTVAAPESIAGISAHVSDDGAKVEFDGAILEFGQTANDRGAPLALPWILGSAWTEGYIESAGRDGDAVLVTCLLGYGEEQLTVETWLASEGIPLHCDVICDGRRFLAVTIRDFSLI